LALWVGIELLPERAISQVPRSVDRDTSDCFLGSRLLTLLLKTCVGRFKLKFGAVSSHLD